MSQKDEEKEDRDMEKTLRDFAKSMKEVKRKNWEPYKDTYPELYKEEFGTRSTIHSEGQKIIDKMQDKIEYLTEENKELKYYIRTLTKEFKKKIKEIDNKEKKLAKIKKQKIGRK